MWLLGFYGYTEESKPDSVIPVVPEILLISFSVKDEETLKKRVLSEAVRVAEANARVLAETAGRREG